MPVAWIMKQAPPPAIPPAQTGKRLQEIHNAAGTHQGAKQYKDGFKNTSGRSRIFENSHDLNNLMHPVHHIMLNRICAAMANMGDTTNLSHIAYIPPTKCIVYSILGHC
jgi:hypothetical protein